MSTTEIVSLITVSVTLILGIAGFIFNSYLQRKNNSISVITNTRLERRNKTQQLCATILCITDYDYNKTSTTEEKKEYSKKLISSVNELISLYSYSFPRDAEFLQSAKNLKKAYCESYQDWKKIETAREKFEQIAVVYIYTEWKRIKLETVGKFSSGGASLPSWEYIYLQTLDYYSNNYEYDKSSNDDNYLKD